MDALSPVMPRAIGFDELPGVFAAFIEGKAKGIARQQKTSGETKGFS
ncbi:MAG: hypothetical protein LBB76_05645 [Azoarcus sp.]|jgi:hypothetical protein|nr:hypothetical protein [Azoarcus sp.]